MIERLEDEAGDVKAAIDFVVWKLGASQGRITIRENDKFELFEKWDKEDG